MLFIVSADRAARARPAAPELAVEVVARAAATNASAAGASSRHLDRAARYEGLCGRCVDAVAERYELDVVTGA